MVKEVMFLTLSLCLFVCFVCLSVCLCAGYLKKLWTHWACDKDELIRFWWNPNPATGIKKMILRHWKIGRKWYIARYFKKMWTDSDETWWTGWVCGKEKLNWFWWRSRSGSDDSNFKVIFHHWEIGQKTIYSTICQKCVGPDMFPSIRHCGAEVCALQSALPVAAIVVIIVDCFFLLSLLHWGEQDRSGMGACTRAVFCNVHFPLVSRGLHLTIPQADAWPIPISLRCSSTCCNHESSGQPVALLHSRGSLAKRIWWAGSASGKRATCPYSHSWHSRTIQVTNLICVSLINCSLDTRSDQQ